MGGGFRCAKCQGSCGGSAKKRRGRWPRPSIRAAQASPQHRPPPPAAARAPVRQGAHEEQRLRDGSPELQPGAGPSMRPAVRGAPRIPHDDAVAPPPAATTAARDAARGRVVVCHRRRHDESRRRQDARPSGVIALQRLGRGRGCMVA
ncbi:hypothetical protein MTO96_047494 [Rhipicephalus appendiculatus]